MKEAEMNTEKRRSPRVETSIPIRYKVLRNGAEAAGVGSVSVTCNLSTGGLRFTADDFLSPACRLIVELDIPAVARPITAASQVAWIQKAKGDHNCQYHVGSQFMEITKKDQELIAAYQNSL